MTKQHPLTCSGHTRPVVHIAFSPITVDGYFLISACKDGNPILRDGKTGDWIGTFFGHKGAVWGVDLNSKASKAVSSSADYFVKLWDAHNGTELKNFEHKSIVRCCTFSKDDGFILTGGQEKLIRIYDIQKGADPISIYTGSSTIKSITCRDNNVLITSGDEKEVRVWDRRADSQVHSLKFDNVVTSVFVQNDMLIVTEGKKVSFWDLERMSEIKNLTVTYEVETACISPDGTRIVAGGSDNAVHVYNFEDFNQIEENKTHHGPVHCVRYSPDGELFASGSEDGTIRLWQTKPGTVYGLWAGVNSE